MKFSNKIIIAAQNGNIEALEEIIKVYSSIAYFHTLKMLHNEQDAQDCTQEAVEKLIANLHEYNVKNNNFNAWAYSIINNHALNYVRSKIRYNNKVIIDEDYVSNYTDENHETNKMKCLLSDLERILTEDEYKILIYKTIHNFKFEEISSILNIPLSRVKRTYYTALNKAQEYVRSNYEK